MGSLDAADTRRAVGKWLRLLLIEQSPLSESRSMMSVGVAKEQAKWKAPNTAGGVKSASPSHQLIQPCSSGF